MLALPITLLALAASAFAADPKPPPLTYLYSVNLTFGDPIAIGAVPYGHRDLLTISGGSFSGPKFSGLFPFSPASSQPSVSSPLRFLPRYPTTQMLNYI